MRKWGAFLLSWLFVAVLAAKAAPFATSPPFGAKSDGQVIFAADWNRIDTFVSYFNNTILSATTGLNVLTTKGDLYVFNGVNLKSLPAGADGTFIKADSTNPLGLVYAAVANLTTLTTAGDTLFFNAGNNQRLPIGTTGQILTVASGLPSWADNTGFPKGSIIAWSPLAAGTSTIPSGFGLCDGTIQSGTQTPNLIGRFVVGWKPTGSGAAPSSGGHNLTDVDANKGTNIFTTNTTGGTIGSGSARYDGTTVPPIACYTLVYICKL
jgi:hypothetical protein